MTYWDLKTIFAWGKTNLMTSRIRVKINIYYFNDTNLLQLKHQHTKTPDPIDMVLIPPRRKSPPSFSLCPCVQQASESRIKIHIIQISYNTAKPIAIESKKPLTANKRPFPLLLKQVNKIKAKVNIHLLVKLAITLLNLKPLNQQDY